MPIYVYVIMAIILFTATPRLALSLALRGMQRHEDERTVGGRRYRPENMCISVCGDFGDPAAVVGSIRKFLEPCAARTPPMEVPRRLSVPPISSPFPPSCCSAAPVPCIIIWLR